MQQLLFTARRKTDAEIYLPLAEQSLTAQVSTLSGEGTGENPYAVQVPSPLTRRSRALSAWHCP